jgi:Na+(H+)/acetate symporter ActP
MSSTAAVWLVLVFAAVAANLPFVNERLFVGGPLREPKSLAWRLVELAVLFALTLALGMTLESRIGQRQPQGWQFYVASACLFLTLAFPGFTWRYLRRHH